MSKSGQKKAEKGVMARGFVQNPSIYGREGVAGIPVKLAAKLNRTPTDDEEVAEVVAQKSASLSRPGRPAHGMVTKILSLANNQGEMKKDLISISDRLTTFQQQAKDSFSQMKAEIVTKLDDTIQKILQSIQAGGPAPLLKVGKRLFVPPMHDFHDGSGGQDESNATQEVHACTAFESYGTDGNKGEIESSTLQGRSSSTPIQKSNIGDCNSIHAKEKKVAYDQDSQDNMAEGRLKKPRILTNDLANDHGPKLGHFEIVMKPLSNVEKTGVENASVTKHFSTGTKRLVVAEPARKKTANSKASSLVVTKVAIGSSMTVWDNCVKENSPCQGRQTRSKSQLLTLEHADTNEVPRMEVDIYWKNVWQERPAHFPDFF